MQITATEAKNRLGYYLAQAEREPVHVLKNDRVAAVLISAARYAELESLAQQKSMAERRQEFNERHGAWIEAQNALVDKIGVFGESLRPW
ncbi:Antitoxin Phd_YefM, type II toxin-antitoxin system [Xylophilus ampelinus]|nr:type II toxin-antitoxin system prevent-host-death family antitoxin [Variovorax sp.]VTY35034.1 Antitoxin Phd_YefM, type II toxin-antitoxin system [Xylophilus ampelinus]|tara:strand:- start:486 stop:755 length:270 start_codon:yes stop_codon:yes gene_type:complete